MIIPVILEASLEEIKAKLALIDGAAPLVQIDIADGKVVEGKTFLDLEKILGIETKADIELHFMKDNPLGSLEQIGTLPCGLSQKVVKVSTEVKDNPWEKLWSFLNKAENLGFGKGLSLDPETPIATLTPFAQSLDFIQLLGVIPGKQGGKFIPQTLERIKLIKQKFPHIPLQIDGGVKKNNIQDILQAGVDNVVIGSAIFDSNNPQEEYETFVNLEKTLKEQI